MVQHKFLKIKTHGDKANHGITVGECEITEKLDGCFTYDTPVITREGALPIGYIVNQKLNIDVLSVNPVTKVHEYKPIINWYNNGKTEDWLCVTIESPTGQTSLHITPQHKVFDGKRFKPINNFNIGDYIYYNTPTLTKYQHDIILGSILGDGSIRNMNLKRCPLYSEVHSIRQQNYSQFKFYKLRNIMSVNETYSSAYSEEYDATEKCRIYSKSVYTLKQFEDMYEHGKKKISESIIDKMTPVVMAIWFCDDGSTSFSDRQRPRATFHTQGFTLDECTILQRALLKFGIESKLHNYGHGYQIDLTADSSSTMYELIAQYIPPSMQYKLPATLINKYVDIEPRYINLHKFKIIDICTASVINTTKYDIEVADNHNYFAKNILVSNSNYSFDVNDETGELHFYSRNNELCGGLENGKSWVRATESVRKAHEANPFPKGYVFFGECMTKHKIDYGQVAPFIGFAVFNKKFNIYVKNWKEFYETREVPVTSVTIVKNPTHDQLLEIADSKTDFGNTGVQREGIVVKNYEKQLFSKIVNDEFREKMSTKQKKARPDSGSDVPWNDTHEIAYTYCTPARIEKVIYKLRDEGAEIEMKLMQHLFLAVFDDIMEEEFLAISHSFKGVNFGQLKSLIGAECAKVLKQVIMAQDQ